MKMRPTKKIIIIFSALLIVLISLHFLTFNFIRQSGITVSTLERDVHALQAQVLEFSKYSPEDMLLLARSVKDHFISRSNIVDFIENLENEARIQNVGVSIRSVDIEQLSSKKDEDKEVVRLKFELRGSWTSIMSFVNYIEHLPYKVTLKGFSLAVSSEKGVSKNPDWVGQVEITVIKLK